MHMIEIPNSSCPVHLHWHIEKIPGCQSYDARPLALQPVVNRDEHTKTPPENFRSMTRIHLEHVDNHEINNILFNEFFQKEIFKAFKQFSSFFLSVLVPTSKLGTHYSVQCSSSWNKSFEQVSSKNLKKKNKPVGRCELIDSTGYEKKHG